MSQIDSSIPITKNTRSIPIIKITYFSHYEKTFMIDNINCMRTIYDEKFITDIKEIDLKM